MRPRALLFLLLALVPTSCSKSRPPAEIPLAEQLGAPLGQLPKEVEPQHYELALEIVPERERFSGTVAIHVRLAEPTDQIWLHGQNLEVSTTSVRSGEDTIGATWRQVSQDGIVQLKLERSVPAGVATIHVKYDAAFDQQLKGLYRVVTGGESYAFTQFEAINARLAFPSFDEPRFKTPFDVTLIVKAGDVAAANTPLLKETPLENGLKSIRYKTTKALPTYLVAWAVGPLDVVKGPPLRWNKIRRRRIPFRGLAAKGQGEKLQYALENTGAILKSLEEYFGIEYPYEKIDIVAVPDFGSGAMENVGLITFRETLLLVDPKTSTEGQRRAFAYVMAHELAHMWFGNLVTMPWWDDIWLNEAFATWMGNKAVSKVYPEHRVELSSLQHAHDAMEFDSLASARQIRQPIESNHDIRNAFDPITYEKGGAVLEMFEHWLGRNTFRKGIRRYIRKHAWGNATAEDLLSALDHASGKDVSTPFSTFLFQPGVPMVKTQLSCSEAKSSLKVAQSRYFPIGAGKQREQSWKFPMCVRSSVGRTCELVTAPKAEIGLSRCPSWYIPNDDGAGYFRFSMPKTDLEALYNGGFVKASARTRIAFADSVVAGFSNASLGAQAAFAWFEPFVDDRLRQVATKPMGLLRFSRDYVADDALRARIEAYSQGLYRDLHRKLGWLSGRNEHGETRLLRVKVLRFLTMTVNDPDVRKRAAEYGRAYVGYGTDGKVHNEAVDPQLASTCLAVAAQEGGRPFFDHLVAMLETSQDAVLRYRLIGALGAVRDGKLAGRTLGLALDERVRISEISRILYAQFGQPETRDDAWKWLKSNFDGYSERFGTRRVGRTPWYTASFCSEARAKEVERFFSERVQDLSGGPRNLAGALEEIRHCAARVEAQRAGITAFFTVLGSWARAFRRRPSCPHAGRPIRTPCQRS